MWGVLRDLNNLYSVCYSSWVFNQSKKTGIFILTPAQWSQGPILFDFSDQIGSGDSRMARLLSTLIKLLGGQTWSAKTKWSWTNEQLAFASYFLDLRRCCNCDVLVTIRFFFNWSQICTAVKFQEPHLKEETTSLYLVVCRVGLSEV